MDTIDFGRFLILDEMANLAEGDTVLYTHALMNLPHEDYKVGWIFLTFFWSQMSSHVLSPLSLQKLTALLGSRIYLLTL